MSTSATQLHEEEVMTGDKELPEGWVTAALGQVAFARLGKTPRRADYRNEGNHRIVKFRDLTARGLDYSATKAAFVADTPSALKHLQRLAIGDVLVTASAHSGDQIGKKRSFVDRVPQEPTDIYFVGELLGITADRRIMNSKWPYYWFSSEAGIDAIQDAVFGVHLTSGRAQSMPVPLAPKMEQDRIVSAVDQLWKNLYRTQDRLAKISDTLKRFRKTVLAAACKGELTEDWRNTHRSSSFDHDSRHILDADESFHPLSDLPDTWSWSTLGECAIVQRGRFSVRPRNNPAYYGGKYPFVQIGDLPPNGGELSEFDQSLNERGLAVSKLFPRGTVLIAIVGATIGNTGVLGFDSCCPDSLVAVRGRSDAHSRFLEYYLRLRKLGIRNESYASGGQPNINLQTLLPYPVPHPPPGEVDAIVQKAQELFKLADAIEKRVAAASIRAERLTQAILAKAFRGELVPTEAELARREGREYEPARVLLERIKAERAAAGQKPKRSSERTVRTRKLS